jgi:hypothetical protein
MRQQANNPTERMERVMAEYATWIAYADALWNHGRANANWLFPDGMFIRPRAEEYAREKAFLEVNAKRARYNRNVNRGKRVIRDEIEAARPQPIDNLVNYRKAAQYAIDNGYCLQGEAPYTDVETLIIILEGVGIQTFLSTVRGPNNKKIPINELNLEYD